MRAVTDATNAAARKKRYSSAFRKYILFDADISPFRRGIDRIGREFFLSFYLSATRAVSKSISIVAYLRAAIRVADCWHRKFKRIFKKANLGTHISGNQHKATNVIYKCAAVCLGRV